MSRYNGGRVITTTLGEPPTVNVDAEGRMQQFRVVYGLDVTTVWSGPYLDPDDARSSLGRCRSLYATARIQSRWVSNWVDE